MLHINNPPTFQDHEVESSATIAAQEDEEEHLVETETREIGLVEQQINSYLEYMCKPTIAKSKMGNEAHLYEILQSEYECYVLGKTLKPTVILTYTQGIQGSILRLLMSLVINEEYRHKLSYASLFHNVTFIFFFNIDFKQLFWKDFVLMTKSHQSDKGTLEARMFITDHQEKSDIYLLWDSHAKTSMGNLVYGGSASTGYESGNILLEAYLGPILFNSLPTIKLARKGIFFLTCGPLMSVTNSRRRVEALVAKDYFSFIVVFCGGSVVPNTITLNLTKAISLTVTYNYSILAAIEVAFSADVQALGHSPVSVTTTFTDAATGGQFMKTMSLVQSNHYWHPFGLIAPACPSLTCQTIQLHVLSTDWFPQPNWIAPATIRSLQCIYWVPYPQPAMIMTWMTGEEQAEKTRQMQRLESQKRKANGFRSKGKTKRNKVEQSTPSLPPDSSIDLSIDNMSDSED
ncbi:hypothetical protein JAAARDRAFT_196131 [Jaapia argillacea MUCL 33604]|uniref:Uncharacterized protein n=1 Tax=Jaapia argillacea MUCL 33604 TaxID=933084 RepID=A0A067PVI3_9AGAM|nr:hypothetical protein JAAARDRAFT_196131 [Jaapia argillacea MUCL 33604]